MKKSLILLSGILLLSAIFSPAATSSSYQRSYSLYFNLGKEAFDQGDYANAILYFESASAIDPSKKKPREYINLIKRIRDQRVQKVTSPAAAAPVAPMGRSVPTPVGKKAATMARPSAKIDHTPEGPEAIQGYSGPLRLDDALWQRQPDMPIHIELQKFLILEGHNIQRFLIVTEGMIHVERVNKDQIKIIADRIGVTFLHVWDDRGRWTFHVTGILPIRDSAAPTARQEKEMIQEQSEPFKFTYSNTWSQYYLGSNVSHLKLQTLNFPQYFGAYGKTPYGNTYGTATYYRFDDNTERIGESLGLTEGNIGPFKDFSIHGRDTSAYFSDLSVPTRNFRGALLEAYAFEHGLKYTTFYGEDRASYLFIAPGLFNVQKSYIEGTRATLFPEGPSQYSFNYAHGWGADREDFLKKEVYSVETSQKFSMLQSRAELGYDTERYAWNFNNLFDKENSDASVRVNFRNIDKQYYAITGRPTAQGELGANLIWDWRPNQANFYSNLDIYRNRLTPNARHPEKTNLRYSGSLDVPVTDTSRWAASLYYTKAPQELSPLEDFRIDNRYTKNFRLLGIRDATVFLGSNYQINRTPDNESTEYNRYGLMTGLRFYLVPQLSFYTNYEYYWVEEKLSGEDYQPQALESGLSYSRQFLKYFSSQLGATYRREIDADNDFSFLSGQDSVRGYLSLNYTPHRDLEIYLDGQMQDTMPANPQTDSFVDASLILGVRSSWDLPISFSPSGKIKGIVYKDLNGNSQQDENESGLPDVVVNVGRQETVTDQNGRYCLPVRAQRLRVGVNIDSLPKGYVLSTASVKDVAIENNKTFDVDFGATSRTTIYGVVFWDADLNGKMDTSEEGVLNVRIILDDHDAARTEGDGSYVFDGIAPGVHTITVDVNSIPMKFIPRVKIRKEVEVAEGTTYLYHIPLGKNP